MYVFIGVIKFYLIKYCIYYEDFVVILLRIFLRNVYIIERNFYIYINLIKLLSYVSKLFNLKVFGIR